MNPTDHEKLEAAFQEVLKLRPPLTHAQGLSRRKAELEMDQKYAGNYVAYLDVWTGDEVERTVVAFAPEAASFQTELAKLEPDVRERVQVSHLPPANVVLVPFVQVS